MKALVLKDYLRFEYEDVPKPQPNNDEVLIKIESVAVCGSDIAGADGSTGRRIPPIIMGHEASGTVEETGKDVTGFKAGDRVTFDSTVYCGECEFCKSNRVNLCENRRVLGVSCDDYRQNGAFCEYIAVPERIVYRMPDNISFDQAALTEPISVAFHGVRLMDIKDGDFVTIFGTGNIALFAVQLVKALYDVRLAVVGRKESTLKLAEELGADYTINSKESDVQAQIMKLTDGKGSQRVLDAAGARSTFDFAIASLQKGGTFVTLAFLEKEYPVTLPEIITRELTIKGSCAFSGEFPESLRLLSEGKIRTDYVISKVLDLKAGGDFIVATCLDKPDNFFKCILHP